MASIFLYITPTPFPPFTFSLSVCLSTSGDPKGPPPPHSAFHFFLLPLIKVCCLLIQVCSQHLVAPVHTSRQSESETGFYTQQEERGSIFWCLRVINRKMERTKCSQQEELVPYVK